MQRSRTRPGLSFNETRGETITAFGRQITPVGRVFQIRWPGARFIWHRPVAIEVREEDGTRRIPISNATRTAIARIVLSGLGIAFLTSSSVRWLRSRRRSIT